ncbi:sensor histidine kinase [Rhodococcus gannanensis]|uniref:histidine kinase n=1 Tax=Rhodococcus gannanensis TaxID=1960308 RepID=A0ABW4P4E0_9NOCA
MPERRPLTPPTALLRGLPLVLVPLMLLASDFPGEFQVPAWYWMAAMSSAVVFLLGARWPTPVSVALSALAIPMFAAEAWGLSGLVPYLGAVALTEAVMRTRRTDTTVLLAACWAAAVLLGLAAENTPFWRAATAVETVAAVGLPLLLGLYLRAQRDLAAQLRARAAEAEARRAHDAGRVRAAERTALARELHDLTAHHMASIVLRIGAAQHVLADADPRVRGVLEDVRATATGALSDVRRMTVALRDPNLGEVALVEPDAVPAEIEAAVDRLRAAGFAVDSDIDPWIRNLDAIGRLTLLRVVQESVTNVMKHADPAATVGVRAVPRDGGVSVTVTNRRCAERSSSGDGYGLVGMAERVELADGTLDVDAAPDEWRVRVWLPAATTGEPR